MDETDEHGPTLGSDTAALPPPLRRMQADPPLSNTSDFQVLRNFSRSSGGSVLFCLSAVSIFFGLSSVVRPILGTSYALSKTLPAIGTIGLYEISLFAVLSALVIRWRIRRDAVSLGMLVALFLVTLGMLISTVANDNPRAVAGVGAAAALLALVQMAILWRWIGVPFSRLAFTGFAVLLAWNCLNTALLAQYLAEAPQRLAREVWPASACVPLLGVFLLYLSAAIAKPGEFAFASRGRDFLQSPGMLWSLAATLVAGSAVHQYATRYVFDLPFYFVDYLPLIGLAAFTVIEVERAYQLPFTPLSALAGATPLAAAIIALATDSFDVSAGLGVGLLGHPAIVFVGFTLLLGAMSARRRSAELAILAAAHAFMAVILFTPLRPAAEHGVEGVNWAVVRLGIAAAGLPALLVYRNAYVWLAALIAAVTAAPSSSAFRDFAGYGSLTPTSQAALLWALFGLGVMLLYCLFGRGLHRAIALSGAAALTLATLVLLSEAEIPRGWMIAALLLALGAAAFWRVKDAAALAILAVPAAREIYSSMDEARGWRYMIVGFVLLGLGALWSVRHRAPDPAVQATGPAAERAPE